MQDAGRWMALINAFLAAVDRKTGSLLHLPVAGGALEQPYKTMQVFQLLQGVFGEELKKQADAQVGKHGKTRK